MGCFENYLIPDVQKTNATPFTEKTNGISFYFFTEDASIMSSDRREVGGIMFYCSPHFPNMYALCYLMR
jgi:hypothetical protein